MENNLASFSGGGLAAAGDTLVRDCEFLGNLALGNGPSCGGPGGPTCTSAFGGGIHSEGVLALVENTLFVGNAVGPVGFGALEEGHAAYRCQLVNCTLVDNGRGPSGSSEVTQGCIITNSIVWDTSGLVPTHPLSSASYSLILGGFPGVGNLDLDPVFRNPGAGDYRLSSSSPAIDAADNGALSAEVLTDLVGRVRFIDDPATPDTGLGGFPVVDMGALEFLPRAHRSAAPPSSAPPVTVR